MKAGFWKVMLFTVVLALALAACAPATGAGDQGSNGAAPTTAAGGTGGETAATAPAPAATAPAGGDTGGAASGVCANVDTAALVSAGETLYGQRCASCHGAQGEGQGNFPALAGNEAITGEDVAGLVTGYFAVDAHPKDISAEDLAGLLSFTRGSFGNTAAVVCPSDITIPAQ